MRRLLSITLGDNWAEFHGPGSRQLYVDLVGKQPVFNTRTRSFVTVPARAHDLAVLAETKGWDVTVQAACPAPVRPSSSGAGEVERRAPVTPAPEPSIEDVALW